MSERKPLYESPGEKGKRGFEDLECNQLALEVLAKIHAFSQTLPADEKYDLYAQIRRSSKSVTANIAEAYGRYHYLESLHYYSTARGELNEMLAHLINARVLEYINQPNFDLLYKLIRRTQQGRNGFMAYAVVKGPARKIMEIKELVKLKSIMMCHLWKKKATEYGCL